MVRVPVISVAAATSTTGSVAALSPIHKRGQHRQKDVQQWGGNPYLPTRESGMAAGIAAALMVMIARQPKMTLKYFIVKVFLWALQCVCQ